MNVRYGLPRPVHGLRVMAGAAMLVLLWAAVARESGSGWVQAVGAVVAALLVVGLLLPAAAAFNLRVGSARAESDAVAGSETTLVLGLNRTARVTPVVPPGEAAIAGPGGRVELAVVPPRRGVVSGVSLELATAWPFGLLWWSRRVAVELPAPLHVAPKPGLPVGVASGLGRNEAGARRARSFTGDLRSTRAYRPGDDRRRVHWPLSAHSGGLVVAEHEDATGSGTVVLRADLPSDPDEAEARAGSVLATALVLLERRAVVLLETAEAGRGLVRQVVRDARQAGRRLARAVPLVPGEAAAPPVRRRGER